MPAALANMHDVAFPGDGEMARLCRAFDWASTPLGPVDQWSCCLRGTAAIILASRNPMFLWWGPDLVQIYNDAYRPSFGEQGRHPAALGMGGRDCWTDIWDTISPQIEQVLQGGPATWHENQYIPIERNGRLDDVWWTYSYSAVRDDDGSIGGVLVVCQETTAHVLADRERERLLADAIAAEAAAKATADERDRLLQALRVERARLEDVFRQAPAFLAVLRGPQHVFELANDAYYQLVGHRPLIGRPVFEALPEVRDQGFIPVLDHVLVTGEPFVGREVSVRLQRTQDGELEERYVDFVYQALTEADGTRSGIAAHGSDVTDQVRARQEVERLLSESEAARLDAESMRAAADLARRDAETARVAAEQANRAKAEFLATMSHELRTPLNAIGGYAELMEMGIRGPVTAEQQADLYRIQQSQRHLLGLVNEVLDLAKVDAGDLRVEHAAVRAGDTVDAALALVRPQAAAKSIRLAEVCDDTGDHPYLGDEPRVRQILVNLLGNAIKFTDPGGEVTVRCAVSGKPRGSALLEPGLPYVAVQVADTGRGISDDQRERIFEPFTQLGETLSPYARPSGGTGLGLTISRRLARLMAGDLTVESRPGHGATFTLWLPAPERRIMPRTGAAVNAPDLRKPEPAEPDAGVGLARVGRALAAEAGPAARAWVARVRSDAGIPAGAYTDDQIEDHATTYVTDVGLALRAAGEGKAESTEALRDSRAILAVVAERHGAQRARLGWTEDALVREFQLLLEVLDVAVKHLAGPGDDVTPARARAIIAQLLAQTERVSVGGFRLAILPDADARS